MMPGIKTHTHTHTHTHTQTDRKLRVTNRPQPFDSLLLLYSIFISSISSAASNNTVETIITNFLKK